MEPVLTADSEQLLGITAYNRTERFAAEFYGVDIETVRGWRKRGRGPRYKKINGKLIRYSLQDLTAWAENQPGPGDSDQAIRYKLQRQNYTRQLQVNRMKPSIKRNQVPGEHR